MRQIILLVCLAGCFWLIRQDTARRRGISSALWIPTLWFGIIASRPLSAWLGFGGGSDSLEGSPVDRLLYFGLIVAAFITITRRNLDWSFVISKNWPVFLFYGYLLCTVLWAESPTVSFKRWFKDFGNIFVVLVILTEVNPQQAFRAVFARCAYLFIPLSIVFIRWFPALGRTYNNHSGGMEACGVTFQKNSLGAMVLVCSLVMIWDWLERSQVRERTQNAVEKYAPFALMLMAGYLLKLSDSKTSIACLLLGGTILAAVRLPVFRKKIGVFGGYALAAMCGFFILDYMFGVKAWIVQSMGRDMTYTGRTEVWRQLFELNTDPIFGTGFCSIWSDRNLLSRLPPWVSGSAHNGYLEVYLDGGSIAVGLLVLMLVMIALKINRELSRSGNYALIRFSALIVAIIANLSESHFGRMAPIGFLFLLVAIDARPSARRVAAPAQTRTDFVPRSRSAPAAEPVYQHWGR